jgi:hypothetical protein
VGLIKCWSQTLLKKLSLVFEHDLGLLDMYTKTSALNFSISTSKINSAEVGAPSSSSSSENLQLPQQQQQRAPGETR